MKTLKANRAVGLAMTVIPLALGAQAQLIDNFNSGDLTPYTQTIVLAQNADPGFTFSASSGALGVSRVLGSGNTPQQDLFLRDDYILSVGYMLRVDASVAINSVYSDFGIAVSATKNPPAAVYAGSNVDARQNYVTVYIKGQTDAIGRAGFNGTVNAGGNSGAAGVPGLANVLGLFISRPAADTFSVGYTTASGDTVLFSYSGMNTSIGNALGFYSDVRATTSYGFLDNLRLAPIPEPSTFALLGLGALASSFGLRRRK